MIRSVLVQKIPMCSTVMTYSKVSLPCEPWLQPTIKAAKPAAAPKTDHELLILEAVKAGHEEFGSIVTNVFGPRMGSVDDRARALMIDMMKRGLLHRALRHHTHGIFEAERVFGIYITDSAGKQVPVRVIGEQHVFKDFGRIPTPQEWLSKIPFETWMQPNPKAQRELERSIA